MDIVTNIIYLSVLLEVLLACVEYVCINIFWYQLIKSKNRSTFWILYTGCWRLCNKV